MTNKTTIDRDGYFDSLKFILITLVVAGHVLEQNRENNLCLALYNMIYLFHMPLFVFISGYFCHKHTNIRNVKSLLLIAESLLFFQLLHKLPGVISGRETLYSIVVYPGWTIWYLYSLIAWRLMIFITPPVWLNKYKSCIIMSVAICLFCGFIPIGSVLSFQRTMVFMPFFLLGYYCGQNYIDIKKYRINNTLSFVILISAFLLMLLFNRRLDIILYGSSPYNQGLLSLCLRIMQLIVAVITGNAIISFTKTLPEKFNKIGRSTLFIYLYHTFIIIALMKLVEILDFPQCVCMAFIEFCIVCIVLLILMRFKILYRLLNPISQLIIK